MSKVGCDCGDEYANTEVEKMKTVFCDCCRKYDWELKLEKAEARVEELEILKNPAILFSKNRDQDDELNRADEMIRNLEDQVKELEDVIASALRIKDLWGPSITGDVMENRALYSMQRSFQELVK